MKNRKDMKSNIIKIIILVMLLVIAFFIGRSTGEKVNNEENNISEKKENYELQDQQNKPYSNNVITIDENKIVDGWKIVEKSYGSIIFFIQGPNVKNEDGTFNDIRINMYIQKSEMTNEELKTQMLEGSIYSDIEYTKMQEINDFQWMEFEAKNKGVKAKILTIMKDGYMYAVEITGEETIYDQHYNDAMKVVMTVRIAERIPLDTASTVIYKYDNIANIKEGGTQYLLASLNLPKTMEKTEENSNLPEEYKDYIWTGIKYDDFANEMKKYMTEEVLKNKFSEFINYKDCLFVKEITGEQYEYMIENIEPITIKGKETTYEVTKTMMNTFITLKEQITLKYEDGKCVVSGFANY